MQIESQTVPGMTKNVGSEIQTQGMLKNLVVSSQTGIASFSKVSHLLSTRELRRPRSNALDGETLKKLAQQNPPAQEWYEGDEEQPF